MPQIEEVWLMKASEFWIVAQPSGMLIELVKLPESTIFSGPLTHGPLASSVAPVAVSVRMCQRFAALLAAPVSTTMCDPSAHGIAPQMKAGEPLIAGITSYTALQVRGFSTHIQALAAATDAETPPTTLLPEFAKRGSHTTMNPLGCSTSAMLQPYGMSAVAPGPG